MKICEILTEHSLPVNLKYFRYPIIAAYGGGMTLFTIEVDSQGIPIGYEVTYIDRNNKKIFGYLNIQKIFLDQQLLSYSSISTNLY